MPNHLQADAERSTWAAWVGAANPGGQADGACVRATTLPRAGAMPPPGCRLQAAPPDRRLLHQSAQHRHGRNTASFAHWNNRPTNTTAAATPLPVVVDDNHVGGPGAVVPVDKQRRLQGAAAAAAGGSVPRVSWATSSRWVASPQKRAAPQLCMRVKVQQMKERSFSVVEFF